MHSKILSTFILVSILFLGNLLLNPLAAVVAQSPARYGGTLTTRIYAEPKHMNPNYEFISREESQGKLHAKLVRVAAGFPHDVVPELARSWDISSDGKTYTFHLAENAKFHDGVKITSKDVKFSYEDVLAKKGYWAGYLADIERIETPDDHTAVFKLKAPNSGFISALGANWASVILPKHLYEGTDPLTNPNNMKPIGSGPWKLVEWVKASHMIFEANLDWFEGRPPIDKVVHKYITSNAVATRALETGEIDLEYRVDVIADVDRLGALPHLRVMGIEYFTLIYVGFNMRRKPYDDLNVRRAIALAVDSAEVNQKALHGKGKIIKGVWLEGHWASNPDVKNPEYDLNEANRILDNAGYKKGGDGIRLLHDGSKWSHGLVTWTSMNAPEVAQVVKEQLKKIGIDLRVESLEFTTYSKLVHEPPFNFDIAIGGGWQGPHPNDFSSFLVTDGFRNYMGYSNAGVDRAFEMGKRAPSNEEAKKHYYEMQRLVMEDLPRFNMVQYKYYTAANKEFHGFWSDVEESKQLSTYQLKKVWWEGAPVAEQPLISGNLAIAAIAAAVIIAAIGVIYWVRIRKKPS
jgi:peptide/nickel transport system substrate-binding protein